MKLSSRIKPVSYLKAHAAEIFCNLPGQAEPLIITHNGEAKVVLQDIESYEQNQETMALLKMPAMGMRHVDEGLVQPAGDVIQRLILLKLIANHGLIMGVPRYPWNLGCTERVRVGKPGIHHLDLNYASYKRCCTGKTHY